ncbi:hypothetical protein M5689_012535 [Euphorbia peplus]|nr:hypothetical protein M5689_012535 [Euphorbia peplus]
MTQQMYNPPKYTSDTPWLIMKSNITSQYCSFTWKQPFSFPKLKNHKQVMFASKIVQFLSQNHSTCITCNIFCVYYV